MLHLVLPTLIFLCLAGIIADIAIIYTIFRFKRLRTAFNIFLANWAISDLLSLIVLPIIYGFMSIIINSGSVQLNNCIFMQAALLLHLTEILFGIVLCIDWCFAAYFQRLSEKFRKYYRYVIASVWVLSLLFYILATGLCIVDVNFSIAMILFAIFYSISLIFVITLQCSRIAQNCRTLPISYPKPLTLRLTLITIIIFSYLLAVISMLMLFVGVFFHILTYWVITVILSAFAILGSSVVTLILLCCLNYDFRQCLFQLRKPAHERFDNEGSEVEDAIRNRPEISFHTSTQDILTNVRQDLGS